MNVGTWTGVSFDSAKNPEGIPSPGPGLGDATPLLGLFKTLVSIPNVYRH